jgi:hypothetical protein
MLPDYDGRASRGACRLSLLSDPQAAAFAVNVFDIHAEGGTDAGEAVDHQADERAITQATGRGHIDTVEQLTGFSRFQDRCATLARAVLGATDRAGRVDHDDLADHQPVE